MLNDDAKLKIPLMILKELEGSGLTLTESLSCLTLAIAIGFSGLVAKDEKKHEENIDMYLASLKRSIISLKNEDFYDE